MKDENCLRNEHLIEIIKNEWADIHHTRKQEWTSLAIIGGVFYALFNAKDSTLQGAITIFGLFACMLSIYMLIRHWMLFKSKMKIIELLERELGVVYNFYDFKHKISVQAIIMFFYFLLTSALAGWLAWILSRKMLYSLVFSIIILIIGIVLFCFINRKIKKNLNNEVWVSLLDKKTGKEKILGENVAK